MNKYNLPKSFEQERDPFVLPGNYKRLGIISDLHIPYHSIEAITTTFDSFLKYGIDSLLINGDLIDFYQLSKFMKDPRKRSVKDELDATRLFLDIINSVFPDARKFYKLGNHDIRYENWLKTKAPELLEIAEYRLDILLRLAEKRIEFIDDKTIVKAGGLTVVHGHELNMKSVTVNPARTLYLKSKVSTLCSHLHVASQHAGKRIDKHVIGCWSTGHLSEESPDYAPYNEWVHGFATVDIEGKEFEVSNYKILKGRAYRT